MYWVSALREESEFPKRMEPDWVVHCPDLQDASRCVDHQHAPEEWARLSKPELALLIVLVFQRFRDVKQLKPMGFWGILKIGVNGILILLVIYMNFNAFVGRYNPGDEV